MGRYTSRQIRLSRHNERASLVFDGETGLPLDTPSSYLVLNGLGIVSHNTLKFRAVVLAQLYNWADELNIDISHRFKSGQVFSLDEIVSLSRYLSKDHSRSNTVKSLRVGGATHKLKTKVVIGFFDWMLDRAYLARLPGDPVAEDLSKRVEITIRQLENLIIKGHRNVRKGLDPEQQKILLNVIRPDSELNPFKKYTRERNYLLFLLLLCTGMRMGELLKISLPELHLEENPPFIRLTGKEIVPDPRLNKPVLKTRGRDIAVTPDLARLIQQYILGSRKLRRAAAKVPPFLFLNTRHAAMPITHGGVQEMVKVLRKASPELENLQLHQLRHTWNDNFDLAFADSGVTEEKQRQIKNYLCGWQQTSKQADGYNRRSTTELSRRMGLELQDKMLGIVGVGK